MIKGVIFDLDGVLVDACEWHYEALNTALTRVTGDFIRREEHLKIFNGLPTKLKLRMLMEAGRIRLDQIEEITNLKQELTRETIEDLASVDEGKREMHQWMKMQGLEAACVTNSVRSSTELMLRCTGQREYLHTVLTSDDVVVPKPDPEGYHKAMRLMNLFPRNILIVEDSPKGRAAAHASGAHVWEVDNAREVTLEGLKKAIASCG